MALFIPEQYLGIAIYDDITDIAFWDLVGDIVQLETDEEYWISADGNQRLKRRSHYLYFSQVDHASFWKVEQWRDNETLVNALVLGSEKHVQWLEDTVIQTVPDRKAPANLSGNIMRLRQDKEAAAVHHYVNLLWRRGWEDVDSSGVADTYTLLVDAGVTSSFASDEQSVSTGSTGETWEMSAEEDFLFGGEELTLSVEFTALNGNADEFIRLRSQDSGAIWSNDEVQVTSTGVATLTHVTRGDTRKVRIEIETRNTTGAGTTTFKFPSLTTNGHTSPVRY